MYKPWTCRKCGAPMYGPNDHNTTAGCAVAWPPTITTGDTSGLVTSGPTIWGSEETRRLARYDEAVRLLREIASYEPLSDSDGGFIDAWSEIEAFLAAEPKEGDMETRPTGIPHYLRDSRLRSNGMREAAEIVRNFRPASACICGNYISFHNGIPTHQPGCLVGECLEIADEIDARADETDESLRE